MRTLASARFKLTHYRRIRDDLPTFDCDKCGETFVVHPDMPLELLERLHVDGCGLMEALMAQPLVEVSGTPTAASPD